MCPPKDTPSLILRGPCHQVGQMEAPNGGIIPFIGGTGDGTCHAILTLADGEAYSTDITFTGQWPACGSDPHGCGEAFDSDASTWAIDNACQDAGLTDAAADGAPGDSE
jgi:hypothetical protein